MITTGKNPFELGSASDHLGTAASALRDSIDDLRRLNVGPSVLGMLTDAMTLCANLAQQLDKATNIELARVNAAAQPCPSCAGLGAVAAFADGSLTCCSTCNGGGVA